MYQAKILVIDDEQNYLDLITETLQGKNYKILQALNGKMGCMVAEKFIPDIIITDWEMPEMNGIETLNHLKKNQLTKDIPVIMCTGIMTSSKNLHTALDAGAADFIRKPVDTIELTARINSALNLSKSIRKIKSQNDDLINLNKRVTQHSEEIMAQNLQLQHLNATKDKFFSIIAHDLRNPFSNILGLLELMTNDYTEFDKNRILQYIKTIHDSASSTYKLLGNLLEWAMSQTGKAQYNPEHLALDKLISSIVVINKSAATAKNINLSHMVMDNIQILADRNMLNTILNNLVVNAIKYTNRNGAIEIKAIANEHDVKITVTDNGVGIKSEVLGKLFDITEKTSTQGTEKEKGTGLGLILCKEFIEKHGGEIGVDSELGKGSKFWVSLPIK
jgi:two-component system, sensor histidine kinase and response regulator